MCAELFIFCLHTVRADIKILKYFGQITKNGVTIVIRSASEQNFGAKTPLLGAEFKIWPKVCSGGDLLRK